MRTTASSLVVYCQYCGTPLSADVTCAQCYLTFYDNPIPSACVLLCDGGEILLIKRSRPPFQDYWDLPGGFCEPHEAPEETAIREVYEETGLIIDVVQLFGIWMDSYTDGRRNQRTRTTMNLVYTGALSQASRVTSHSDEGVSRWWPCADLPTRIAFPDSTGSAILRMIVAVSSQ